MEINNYIYFSIAGLINLIVLLIIFFTKRRKYLFENNIYVAMMLATIVGIINEIIMVYCVPTLEIFPLIKEGVAKLFLIITELWIFLLSVYTLIVSNNILKINETKTKKNIYLLLFIYIVCVFITIILPINYAYNNTNDSWLYTYGPSTKVVFITAIIYISFCLFYIIKNKLIKKTKKFIPIYTYIVLSSFVSFLQQINPNILMISFVETIILLLMYHTIENPDMKLLEELENNRTLIENNNEEKSNLLFKLAQEVRIPIKEIESISANMLEKTNDLINDAKNINIESKNLSFLVDNILDISSMDINKIKLYKNKFDIYKLYNEIILMTKNNIKNDIKFNSNIINNLPLIYGDSIKLKQIICSILNYSINNTKNGYIELDIDAITNYDMARIIMTIKDTGKCLELHEINEIISYSSEKITNDNNLTMNLKEVNNVIKLLNGTFLIKSRKNEENVYRIIIDHEIEVKNNLTNILKDKKQVLLIDDNYEELKEYTKILKQENIKVTTSMYGNDCINRIRNKEKYDLIIIDDEMQPYNAIKTYEELMNIPNFKTKVIIMLGLNKEFIKEHYINDYKFKDYILKRNYKKELKRIIDKYL